MDKPFIDRVEEFLNTEFRYAILRNHDVQQALENGGDIDMLVESIPIAERLLRKTIGAPLLIVRRSYVTSYYYREGSFDMVEDATWRGASYLVPSAMNERTRSDFGFWKLRPAHEAVVNLLSSILYGGFVNKKYAQQIREAQQIEGDPLLNALHYALGRSMAHRVNTLIADGHIQAITALKHTIRARVLTRSFTRHPAGTYAGWYRHWLRELLLRLNPPVPWIAFMGPDGSGKTTLIEAFAQARWLQKKAVVRYHWRPGLIFAKQWEGRPVIDPHANPPRGKLTSMLALSVPILDWWVGYALRIIHQRAKTQFVIFDRCFLDVLVDNKRYRYGGPKWFAHLCAGLVPRPDIIFVLDAPIETLRSRKRELPEIELARQRIAYRSLVQMRTNVYLIDMTRPIGEVTAEIAAIVQGYLGPRERANIGEAVA